MVLLCRVDVVVLLMFFDLVVWFWDCVFCVFDFDYCIEIYVLVEKCCFGYYLLFVFVGDCIVVWVDFKVDWLMLML